MRVHGMILLYARSEMQRRLSHSRNARCWTQAPRHPECVLSSAHSPSNTRSLDTRQPARRGPLANRPPVTVPCRPHLHLLQRHELDQTRHDGARLGLAHIDLLHIQAADSAQGGAGSTRGQCGASMAACHSALGVRVVLQWE